MNSGKTVQINKWYNNGLKLTLQKYAKVFDFQTE